jgi:Family of unknown function (DUF5677)
MAPTSKTYVNVPIRIPHVTAVELSKLDGCVGGLNELKSVADALLDQMRSQLTNSHYKLVAYIIFSKGFKTFQAIQLLWRSGYGSDALSLCASLFENIIDVLYIGKAPVRRSMRYMQFEQVEKFYKVQKILKMKRLPRGVRRRYKGYMRSLTPEVAKLPKHFPNFGTGWSQKTLALRAKALGRRAELDYNEKYWVYCGHKHTLPMAVSGWTVGLPDGSVDVSCGPDAKEVFNAVKESAELFSQLCFIINEIFCTSFRTEIQNALGNIGAAAEAVKRSYPELLD